MWDQQFEDTLRRSLPLLSPDEELSPDLNLRDLGLDSLGIVELLTSLESGYDVRFAGDALTQETFATPSVLWKTLSGLRDGGSLPAA